MADTFKSERIRNYAKSIFSVGNNGVEESTLESMTPQSDGVESLLQTLQSRAKIEGSKADFDERQIRQTFENIRTDAELTPDDQQAFEAIIYPGKRPVADIEKGQLGALPEGEFFHLVNDAVFKQRIETAMASVGCILVPNDPRFAYGGTGFVVGNGLVMTNRHVARLFAEGVGDKRVSFVRGQTAAFTPGRETENTANDKSYQVKRVVMIHPYYDMALLEIPDLPLPALTLDPFDPTTKPRMVAVVGYPAFDPRNSIDVQKDIFRSRFYVKRMSPGYFYGRRKVTSFESIVNAGRHDSTTLGGNSGSAVIDVQSGHVLGLHFAGLYLDTNFAVPVLDLSTDSRVVDAGVNFQSSQPSPTNPAAKRWQEIDGTEQLVVQPQSSGGTEIRITIPIEVTLRVGQIVTNSSGQG